MNDRITIRRIAKAGAIAATALALAGVTGCGEHGSHKGASATGQAGGKAAAAPNAPAQQALSVDARKCTALNLRPDLTFQDAADGWVNSMLSLTNKGDATCTIKGAVKVTIQDATDEVNIKTRTIKKNFPGVASKITLAPGTTAFSGVRWEADPSCALAGGVGVSAPGEASVQRVNALAFGDDADRFRICGKRITVGTLQPTSEGVNFS